MYSYLARNIIYPFADLLYGSSVISYYKFLDKSQWWNLERLRELQNQKLTALIKVVYSNVPYFTNLLKERGLSPDDINRVEKLELLPVLSKSDIRANFDNLLSVNFRNLKPIKNSTGGSTGEPLKYFITKDEASISWAGIFRSWSWAGYHIGDKRITFGGSSLIPNQKISMFQFLRQNMERNLPLSAISMNNNKYEKYLNVIRKYRPKYLKGYPSSLFMLADYCKNNNVTDIKFNAIFSTAEVLPTHYREIIEKQFNCQIYDQYGSQDGGAQALECNIHKGFHISVEKIIMEVVDDAGKTVPPNQPGHIIVTDLHNYAQPFIRYDTGDIGILDNMQCVCGRGLPLLKNIEGRTSDIIKLSNGVILAGMAIPHLLRNYHIKQYQFIQETGSKLVLIIVKDSDYSENETNHIVNALYHHIGKDIELQLVFSQEIIPGPNGKHKFIVSKI